MKAEECKIGMKICQGVFPLIGYVKDLSFTLNDYGGLVPSAKISWILGKDTWEDVQTLENADAVVEALGRAAYEKAKAAINIEPVRFLDPTGKNDGEPII
jgi:hypothetical protein